MGDKPTAADRRPFVAWWRRHFGTPPTFSFSFAHIISATSGISLDEAREAEQEERKRIIRRWEQGL
jgi:hypothetical protein